MSANAKLQPALLVGVGGSGAKSLRTIRQTLLRKLRAKGWKEPNLPTAWQLLAIDTVTGNDPDSYPEELLPSRDYLGLVHDENLEYPEVRDHILRNLRGEERLDGLAGWLPQHTNVPIAKGAGQYRGLGRAISAYSLGNMRKRIQDSINLCNSPSSMEELAYVSSLLSNGEAQTSRTIMPWIIASMAGGSGSGIFLDVAEAMIAANSDLEQELIITLFGPDIFEPILEGPAGAGIPANTLAATAAVTAGVWGHDPRPGTRALFAAHGVDGARGYGSRVAAGAMRNFVIGAKNSSGSVVGYLNDAYRALGESVAIIMTDPEVLYEWNEIFTANIFAGSGDPVKCGDRSGLFPVPSDHTMPFASFGSAKVSLGTQRLKEYASHSIARHCVEGLLWPRFDVEDEDDDRVDAAKIRDAADRLWVVYLERSRLDERASRDDVVDALKPRDLSQMALSAATSMVGRAGEAGKAMDPASWIRNINVIFDVALVDFQENATFRRRELCREWVKSVPQHVLDLTTEVVASQGLSVGVELLNRLREEIRFVASEQLPVEAEEQMRVARDLPGVLSRKFNDAGFAAIDMNNPILDQVRGTIAKALELHEGAVRYRTAAALMLDFDQNYLSPLAKALETARKDLLEQVDAAKLPDGRANPFPNFPRLLERPSAFYRPATTERMLIDPDDFPEVLEKYTKRSLEGELQNRWREEVSKATIFGRTFAGKELDRHFIEVSPDWQTQVPEAQSMNAPMPTTARFEILSSPLEFVERAEDVISDSETAIGRLMEQSLEDYLNSNDPEIRNSRQSDFVAKLTQAFQIGSPLVEENDTLMRELHPNARSGSPNIVCSTIPVDSGSSLYQQIQNSLTAADFWDANKSPGWFGKSNTNEITIFQGSKIATSAMPLSSLMAPAMKQWMKIRDSRDNRLGFWKHKRARPLTETIPVAREQLNKLVKGYFVAKLLDRLSASWTNTETGFKCGIWSEDAKGFVDFPFPLLGVEGESETEQSKELLAGLLQSILVAMFECNHQSSLSPLRPYQELIRLGENEPRDLIEWIETGETPSGAPVPNSVLVGSAADTPEDRRAVVLQTLEKSQSNWKETFRRHEEPNDPFGMPVSWELRHLVESEHDELITRISHLDLSAGSEDVLL